VRGTIKKIADGVAYRIPPTIDDPAILEEISADLAAIGYPRAAVQGSGAPGAGAAG
jgi:propionyl-CoA synthetase